MPFMDKFRFSTSGRVNRMDPSVEDVGGGAAWRTGIVGEAGTGGVEAAGGEAGAGCSGGGNCG